MKYDRCSTTPQSKPAVNASEVIFNIFCDSTVDRDQSLVNSSLCGFVVVEEYA